MPRKHPWDLPLTYDPDEAPTGRSNVTARLYKSWIHIFDEFTDAERVTLLEILSLIAAATGDTRHRRLQAALWFAQGEPTGGPT